MSRLTWYPIDEVLTMFVTLPAPDAPAPLRGLYLGLDTLNMAGPDGTDVPLQVSVRT